MNQNKENENQKTDSLHCRLTGLLFLGSNCGKVSTGVCTGFSSEYNSTYCKDGWTKDECDEWDELEVNGVSWTFHKGQTCEERGTPATQ